MRRRFRRGCYSQNNSRRHSGGNPADATTFRRGHHRRWPQRSLGRHRPGAGRATGHRPGGEVDDRRRCPVGGLDASWIHPRHLFDSPRHGRGVAVLSHAAAQRYGLDWIEPPASLAHPLDDGTVAVLERSIDVHCRPARARRSGVPVLDGSPSCRIGRDWKRRSWARLRHSAASVRAGAFWTARPAYRWRACSRRFEGAPARALLAGIAAHGMLPLDRRPSAGVALTLGALGHTHRWVFPRGGRSAIVGRARCAPAIRSAATVVTGREIAVDRRPSSALARRCAIFRRDRSCESPATGSRRPIAVCSSAIAMAWRRSKSTGRSTARSRGGSA